MVYVLRKKFVKKKKEKHNLLVLVKVKEKELQTETRGKEQFCHARKPRLQYEENEIKLV